MSVSITSPANDNDPLPDPITGDYAVPAALAKPDKWETAAQAALSCTIPSGYAVSVTISSASIPFNATLPATLTCTTDTTGTWLVNLPARLTNATDYVITVDDGHAGDTKSGIHKP